MYKFQISTFILVAGILLTGILLVGCGESTTDNEIKTKAATIKEITAWCKSKNDLPIYPDSTARGDTSSGPFEGRLLFAKAHIHEVDKWYMKEFDAKRWQEWGLWKQDGAETKQHSPAAFFFLTDGKLEISLSLTGEREGTLILMSASPHDPDSETHLEHAYKCVRKSKNPTHVFMDK